MSAVPHSAPSQYHRAFANVPQTETSGTGEISLKRVFKQRTKLDVYRLSVHF